MLERRIFHLFTVCRSEHRNKSRFDQRSNQLMVLTTVTSKSTFPGNSAFTLSKKIDVVEAFQLNIFISYKTYALLILNVKENLSVQVSGVFIWELTESLCSCLMIVGCFWKVLSNGRCSTFVKKSSGYYFRSSGPSATCWISILKSRFKTICVVVKKK